MWTMVCFPCLGSDGFMMSSTRHDWPFSLEQMSKTKINWRAELRANKRASASIEGHLAK